MEQKHSSHTRIHTHTRMIFQHNFSLQHRNELLHGHVAEGKVRAQRRERVQIDRNADGCKAEGANWITFAKNFDAIDSCGCSTTKRLRNTQSHGLQWKLSRQEVKHKYM